MSTQPISPSASLTSLAEQFTQWRATRSRLRSPVPTALRQQALELLSAYSKSQVIKTLGINSTMLKNWQQALGGDESMTNNPTPSFVPLPAEALIASPPIDASPIDLTLHLCRRALLSPGQFATIARRLDQRLHGL